MSTVTSQILEQLQTLTSQETQALVKQIEAVFNVDMFSQVTFAYSLDPINLTGEHSEKPMEFDVVLEQVPTENKIAIIKALRSLIGTSLRESKQMVDSIPTTINQSVDLQIAEATKIQLEAVGATVVLK